MLTGRHEHLVLQRTCAVGVTVGGGHVGRAGVHTNELGVDGLPLGSCPADVSLHGEFVIALFQGQRLDANGYFSSSVGFAQLGVALP